MTDGITDRDQDPLVTAWMDTGTPNTARIYDYFLGGKDNFACDRAVAHRVLAVAPEVAQMSRASRAYLGRVVRFLAQQGIRQFIDIGAGLPTQQNVHEVAQSITPDARVVYIDNDPTVLIHARALLADNPNTTVVEGDLEHPHQLLANPDLRRHIDFDQPVGLLLTAVLYYVLGNDRRATVVATLRNALCSGSYLALSHIASDSGRPGTLARAQEIYRMFVRYSEDPLPDREQVRALFNGLDLVAPGLVSLPEWRPDQPVTTAPTWFVGGVARKP